LACILQSNQLKNIVKIKPEYILAQLIEPKHIRPLSSIANKSAIFFALTCNMTRLKLHKFVTSMMKKYNTFEVIRYFFIRCWESKIFLIYIFMEGGGFEMYILGFFNI